MSGITQKGVKTRTTIEMIDRVSGTGPFWYFSKKITFPSSKSIEHIPDLLDSFTNHISLKNNHSESYLFSFPLSANHPEFLEVSAF